MKRIALFLAVALLAAPAYAQVMPGMMFNQEINSAEDYFEMMINSLKETREFGAEVPFKFEIDEVNKIIKYYNMGGVYEMTTQLIDGKIVSKSIDENKTLLMETTMYPVFFEQMEARMAKMQQQMEQQMQQQMEQQGEQQIEQQMEPQVQP